MNRCLKPVAGQERYLYIEINTSFLVRTSAVNFSFTEIKHSNDRKKKRGSMYKQELCHFDINRLYP